MASMVSAACIFHTQMSDALIARGDDCLASGNALQAVVFYRRALFFDRESVAAADRELFAANESGDHTLMQAVLATAEQQAIVHPPSGALELDIAICAHLLYQEGRAVPAYARAARLTHDPKCFVLAGNGAWLLGAKRHARTYWLLALHEDPMFLPALRALKRHPA